MISIAFTLGIVGSLHCVLMCGPLALRFGQKDKPSKLSRFLNSLEYNLGRSISYSILGLFFGVVSSLIFMAGIQKVLTIGMGFILILVSVSGTDLEQRLNAMASKSNYYSTMTSFIGRAFSRAKVLPSFVVGMINGVLPCGLVYLALAGALSTGNLYAGALFMFVFGLGTIPLMIATMILGKNAVQFIPFSLKKMSSYVSVIFGSYLIYRGIFVTIPMELDFYSMLKDPIMCH